MKSYRLSAFDELPRTGPPEQFNSYSDYQRTVAVMVKAGLIEDATKLWWDVRPSARFPTVEMRISDMPPLLDDTIAIAAMYRCICRMLYRLRRANMRWRSYSRLLISENRWRAKRYGMDEGLVDFGRGEVVPYAELVEELIELLYQDAEYFGCVTELESARDIVLRGTSAHRQVAAYNRVLKDGGSKDTALKAVVDQLIEETMTGF